MKRYCPCPKSYARERGKANACHWSKAKHERCIQDVKASGSRANPFAVECSMFRHGLTS